MNNLQNLQTKFQNAIKKADKKLFVCAGAVVLLVAVILVVVSAISKVQTAKQNSAAAENASSESAEETVPAETLPAETKENPVLALTADGPVFPSLELAAVPTTEAVTEIYRLNDQHEKVREIQQRLMELGFMDSDEPTDYFGPSTENAVKVLQRQLGQVQDGIVGPETMTLLMSEEAPHYAAKKGDEGPDIISIQQRLYQLGYLATEDLITGTFGDKTEEAVIKLQEVNALAKDGKVGIATYNLIYSDMVKANMLSFGDKSELVLAAQKRLFDLGYMTSVPDGNYGEDTSVAIKLFQQKNALIVDGYLGPETRDVLMSEAAAHNGLGLGDENEQVTKTQQLLAKYGYLNDGNVTGYFGGITRSAVLQFQEKNGLAVDGMVGAQTLAKLTSESPVRAAAPVPTTAAATAAAEEPGQAAETTAAAVVVAQAGDGGAPAQSSDGNVPSTDAGGVSGSVSAMLDIARSKIGCPYSWGAKGPNAFDCSGFVYWVLKQCGIAQSYITSYGWQNVGKYTRISNYNDLRAGDILVVSGHVAFVSTNGNIIDASSSNGRVIERSLGSWWANHFIVGWRIF